MFFRWDRISELVLFFLTMGRKFSTDLYSLRVVVPQISLKQSSKFINVRPTRFDDFPQFTTHRV